MKITSSLPLLVAFTLAGCGGSSEDSPPPNDLPGGGPVLGPDDGGLTDTGDTTGGGGTTSGTTTGGSGTTGGAGTDGGTTAGSGGTTDGGTTAGSGGTTGGGTTAGGSGTTGGDDGTDGSTTAGGGGTTGGGTTAGGSGTTDGAVTAGGGTTGGGATTGGGGDEPSLTPLEALEAASRIDSDYYSALIARTQAVETAGRFTSENYLDAFVATSQVTRGNAPFSRAEFLALLERQILAGESPLDFLNITEGSFNRVHLCPDGGRLLARKSEDDGVDSLTGSYTFEECEIGAIFVNGSYGVSRQDLSDDRVRVGTSFNRLRIDGVDDIATVLSVNIDQELNVTDDGTGGEILSTDTSLRGGYTVGIADVGMAVIDVYVIAEELVGSDEDLEATDVLPSDARSIRIVRNSSTVDDTISVSMSSSTSTNLAEAPESSEFEQGEMDFTLRPATNRLTVQVANGDPDSFDAFILEADNSVVSFTVPWEGGDYEFGSGLRRLPVLFDPR